jgi:hypothetical protein
LEAPYIPRSWPIPIEMRCCSPDYRIEDEEWLMPPERSQGSPEDCSQQ